MEQIVNQPMQAPTGGMQTHSYAGFWKRFLANIIDQILMSILCFVIFIPVLGILGIGALSDMNADSSAGFLIAIISAYAMAVCLMIIAEWLYFALMESKKGATLGKMALGILVTDMTGNQVSFGRATGRYFGKIISALILYIGFIMAGFTQQKQALHDIMAGTLVVNK